MVEIIWSERAKCNLREILDYLKQDSLDIAHSFKEGIKETIENLNSFPQMGRTVPEINYRELFFDQI